MKPMIKQKAKDLLSSVKLRRTHPRVAILTVLLSADRPMTHDQISAKLTAGVADKVTIYRTLETFLRTGLVHKAFLKERTWHFELAYNCTETQCHPHFTCTNCGDTHCLTEMAVPLAKTSQRGFVISRQRLQLEGLCPDCSTN